MASRILGFLGRWAWTIPVMALAFCVVLGVGVWSVVVHPQLAGWNAIYATTGGPSPAAQAAAKGLPAPPSITSGGEKTVLVRVKSATGSTTTQRVVAPVGQPVNETAKIAHDYSSGLLRAPAGPGTMQDVGLQGMLFKYGFAGDKESVVEFLGLRNSSGYPLASLRVPVLPGAYNAHLNSFDGAALRVQKGDVTVPVAIPANSGYGYWVVVVYRVPDNFDAVQTWTMPAFSTQGLWVGLFSKQPYLTIAGPFHPAPGLQSLSGGGGRVWASAGNYSLTRRSPVKAGTTFSWRIVPTNARTYPGYVHPPSGNVLGPSANLSPFPHGG